LDFDPDELGAKLEPKTGQYYFPPAIDESGLLKRQFSVIALLKEIGDVEVSVWTLRKTALEVLSADSITAKFLLGDQGVIPLALIPELRRELHALRNHAEERAEQALLTFAGDMEELAEAALREGNPISP